ncbi:hypothetical protein SAMN05216275_12253 [Streptosporangium canum]|uniref:Uncharacterized protein n=1 Tax=Streptosporangium canum TaxID=324952 RepID=A0A1I3YIL8_9ACTN|nr:hypothetical protein [Streptosporangium canum]SFK31675.1 hypothetical protein SAMN05216275_12253 [Streptosporangium canum]
MRVPMPPPRPGQEHILPELGLTPTREPSGQWETTLPSGWTQQGQYLLDERGRPRVAIGEDVPTQTALTSPLNLHEQVRAMAKLSMDLPADDPGWATTEELLEALWHLRSDWGDTLDNIEACQELAARGDTQVPVPTPEDLAYVQACRAGMAWARRQEELLAEKNETSAL